MPLSHKDANTITEADLQRLADNRVLEGRTIDYKATLYGRKDADKRELLKDVSAFANAAGGWLLLGLPAPEGYPQSPIPGLPLTAKEADVEILRLEESIRDSIEPKLLSLQVRAIPLANGNFVIAIHVGRSWNPPHRVTFGGLNKFYIRHSGGNHELSLDELRDIFTRAAGLTERIRAFRVERVARIYADEGPVRLERSGRLLIHIVPLSTFGGTAALEMGDVADWGPSFAPMGCPGSSRRYNFEGFLLADVGVEAGRCRAYTQIFRDGVVEGANGCILYPQGGMQGLAYPALERWLFDFIKTSSRALSNLGVTAPYAILISLLGLRGSVIDHFLGPQIPLERDDLLVPEILLEDPTFEGNWHRALRPALDAIYNAYGFERCPSFDDEGKWTAPKAS